MEILVHVTAPSSTADDARYRAQVHAITRAFQQPAVCPRQPAGASSHPVSPSPSPSPPSPPSPLPPPSPLADPNPAIEGQIGPSRDRIPPERASPISVIPDSQPEAAIIGSPSLAKPAAPVQRTVEQVSSTSPQSSASCRDLLLPQEIHPPPPPISTAPFSTHITPTLAMLTQRLNPARTYQPLHQARALDPLERGYWTVQMALHDCPAPPAGPDPMHQPHTSPRTSTWDTSSFHRFWAFLAEFIGKDARAGWGVWCIVERAQSPGRDSPSSSAAPESVSVVLKVYAWGEVAMHIYLLLFLASERQIRRMGAEWRDYCERTVIQMP